MRRRFIRSRPRGTGRGPITQAARGAVLVAVLLGWCGPALAATLTSAPVDASLFRDGEVKHLAQSFERWTVLCDEVTRLHRRYCSLRSPVVDAAGAPLAWLTVSTGDDGRPTALLELPLGTRLSTGVRVEGAANACKGKAARSACAHGLDIAECDGERCYAVWVLNGGDLAMLNAGAPLRFVFRQSRAIDPLPASLRVAPASVVNGAVPTVGFASAIAASLQ